MNANQAVAKHMIEAASRLLDALDPEQRKIAPRPFAGAQRHVPPALG